LTQTGSNSTKVCLRHTRRPLSKLDINRKLSSDYPVSEVGRALTRLTRESNIKSNRINRRKQGYCAGYHFPVDHYFTCDN